MKKVSLSLLAAGALTLGVAADTPATQTAVKSEKATTATTQSDAFAYGVVVLVRAITAQDYQKTIMH